MSRKISIDAMVISTVAAVLISVAVGIWFESGPAAMVLFAAYLIWMAVFIQGSNS